MAKKTYEIVVGSSFASAEEAAKSAQIKVNASTGEVIGIAADAMCCCGQGVPKGPESKGGAALVVTGRPCSAEWDVYVLIRH